MNLRDAKIWIGNNENLCRQVQEVLLKAGCLWSGEKEVKNTYATSLYIDRNLSLSYEGNGDKDYFMDSSDREILVKELLGKVKPDDLVRFMVYGSGCNNKSDLLRSEEELKEKVREFAQKRDWTGEIIGYKLIPLFKGELTTKLTKIKTPKK